MILPFLLRRFEEGGRLSLFPTSGSEEGARPSLSKTIRPFRAQLSPQAKQERPTKLPCVQNTNGIIRFVRFAYSPYSGYIALTRRSSLSIRVSPPANSTTPNATLAADV